MYVIIPISMYIEIMGRIKTALLNNYKNMAEL